MQRDAVAHPRYTAIDGVAPGFLVNLPIDDADRRLLAALALRVRFLTLRQIVRAPWCALLSEAHARRRAARLESLGLVRRARVMSHPVIPLNAPLTTWTPACDIYETTNELVVKAELPEVKKEDVQVTIENNVLTIRGERKFEAETKKEEYHRVERSYGEVVGESPAMRKVFKAIGMVADTESTVLVLGETGTGKELTARAIHNLSRRRHGVMVKVNCAALPASLAESASDSSTLQVPTSTGRPRSCILLISSTSAPFFASRSVKIRSGRSTRAHGRLGGMGTTLRP